MTPRWARRAYAGRRSGWALDRPRRWRVLREHQMQMKACDPCWRTSLEGRAYQAALQVSVDHLLADATLSVDADHRGIATSAG